jgi:hypothetical protein
LNTSWNLDLKVESCWFLIMLEATSVTNLSNSAETITYWWQEYLLTALLCYSHWNMKIHYHVHSRQSLVPNQNQTNPEYNFSPISLRSNLILCHDLESDYRRGLDWRMDLLTTYTHDLELQVITEPPLISTIRKLPQQPRSLCMPAVFISRFLALEILRLHAISLQNWTPSWQLTTNWVVRIVFQITHWHGPHSKHPRFNCCSCLAMGCITPFQTVTLLL